jgi:hypothetical protein
VTNNTIAETHEKDNFILQSNHWYHATLKQLELADLLGTIDVKNVQTIAILTLCFGNFGETEREYMLIGAAINSAKFLGMHRLGTEATFAQSSRKREYWSKRADRELGRRLWWALVIYDWGAVL